MKKLHLIVLIFALFLTGCEKKPSEIPAEEVFTITDGVTHDGVKVGDDKNAFTKAYNSYPVQVAYNDTSYSGLTVMSAGRVPYDQNISTLIAGIFVDGNPISEEDLCSENEIEASELASLLSSSSFLQNHEVIYRYLRFVWEEGTITGIDSAELNYNEAYDVPLLD